MYWDEDYCKKYILQYQETEDEEERKRIYEQHLHKPIMKMIYAQINTHKFHRFEPFDVLVSVALEQTLKQLDKYKADYWVESKNRYARTFDYFSLVVKQSMFHYTKKREKKRNNDKSIDDFYDLHGKKDDEKELQWEYFCRFVDREFHKYMHNKNQGAGNSYILMWQHIRKQDYRFLIMRKKQFFDYFRKLSSENNSYRIRNMRRFLYDMADYYTNGNKPLEIKEYEKQEKKRNKIEYFTVELFNKKIKYKKQNNRITRLEEMSLSEST